MVRRNRHEDPSEAAVLCQAASRCLTYPDGTFFADLPLLTAALATVSHPGGAPLRVFVADAAASSPDELAQRYVDTFDFTRRHALHLTWWTDGDTRRRGHALVGFKQVYRAHGFEFAADDAGTTELPDFLPAVLEFTAQTGDDTLLREHRPALELLRHALAGSRSPYTGVLDAVRAILPGPSAGDQAAARAMARRGPRREDVGLAPYGHLDLLPILTTEPR